MGKIKLNGKVVTTEEALVYLRNPKTKLTKFSMTLDREEGPRAAIEPSDEGFDVPKGVVAELSAAMTRMDASMLKWKLSGSPYIRKRNLLMVMYEPETLRWYQKLALRLL
jgi:hypothetical protein